MFLGILAVSGCSLLGTKGTIRSGEITVQGVKDAGKPASLNTSTEGEKVALPQGSKITTTETTAQPATQTQPAQPAKVVTVIEPGAPTEWTKTVARVSADTGTVDTSIALHKVDVAERRILLYVAIGSALAGLILKSMMPAWPGLSNGLLLGAGFFGAAWKFSEIPAWLGAVAILAMILLALGHKRAEWDKDGDGIPDVLEKK